MDHQLRSLQVPMVEVAMGEAQVVVHEVVVEADPAVDVVGVEEGAVEEGDELRPLRICINKNVSTPWIPLAPFLHGS